jgi:hypothetical protein
MSRYIFDSTIQDQPVRITVGYDRQTSTFYLTIAWIRPDTDVVECYASDLRLAYNPADPRSVRRFLESLEIKAPASVWNELHYDAATQTGNRVVRIRDDVTMNELLTW